jgi:hypothetical protein
MPRVAGSLALAALLAVAGCGSTPVRAPANPAAHLPEFLARADRLCAARRSTRPPPRPQNAVQAVTETRSQIRMRTTLNRRLGALTAPPVVAADFRDYRAATGRLVGWLRIALAAATGGQESQFALAATRFENEVTYRSGIARRIGFAVCGRRRTRL